MTPTSVLFKPMVIHHYEIIDSRFNEGKKLLMAQVTLYDAQSGKLEDVILTTEATLIVATFRQYHEKGAALPYCGKITRNRNGQLIFSGLNRPEKKALEGAVDPCPPNPPKPNNSGPSPFGNRKKN